MMEFILTAAIAVIAIDYISMKRRINILEHQINSLRNMIGIIKK